MGRKINLATLTICLTIGLIIDLALASSSNSTFTIDSIEPKAGPTYGDTKVLVRGSPITNSTSYPAPKCKFGKSDMVVLATYVTCTPSPANQSTTEGHAANRTDMCLQCDNSPAIDSAEIISFTVSLTGDFSDSGNSVPYRYFTPTVVSAIYPQYGPKDGETFVQVWGDNFHNFGSDLRCNFGTKSVQAHYISKNYLTCTAPNSDVVAKAIPFSVTQNIQQASLQDVSYWYYNAPIVSSLVPNFGPTSGGNQVLVKGSNYHPFKDLNVDNLNDTFCDWQDIGISPVTIVNSTKIYCTAPASYEIDQTVVEVTLNNQQYTDDGVIYYYFKPPKVYGIEPDEGPKSGGILVHLYGADFEVGRPVMCNFDDQQVNGTVISESEIQCIMPPMNVTGFINVTSQYQGDQFTSPPQQMLVYEEPELYDIHPVCGPETGHTEVMAHGKNFLDMGFGRAKCIFNGNIYMNATIVNSTHLMCDSPKLAKDQINANMLMSNNSGIYYNMTVSMDSNVVTKQSVTFNYYKTPILHTISPNFGQLAGGTTVTIGGNGYNDSGICNLTVRFGPTHVQPIDVQKNNVTVLSPVANVPDSVVVSVSGNGQDFTSDVIIHYRDDENTFTYVEDFFIQQITPTKGTKKGGTKLKALGINFEQYKYDNGTKYAMDDVHVKFVDTTTEEQIGDYVLVKDLTDNYFDVITPPASSTSDKAYLYISQNLQEWTQVKSFGANYVFTYYDAPTITAISPTFGPVKSPNGETITISGTNFNCPDNDCSDIRVRFGTGQNSIFVAGTLTANNTVVCSVPPYTKPDVLEVEVTFNDQDYTHDGLTYGFFDPYVVSINPRLIDISGSTVVQLKGFGFVNSGDSTNLKSKMGYKMNNNLVCNAGSCSQQANYIDKHTITTNTFAQSNVAYSNGTNIAFNGMTIEASVLNDVYTTNNIEVWYYSPLTYKSISDSTTPQGIPKPIMVDVDFAWGSNDYNHIFTYANFTCRFSSSSGSSYYSKAYMANDVLTQYSKDALPNALKCNVPDTIIAGTYTLDLSINGNDFFGGFAFSVTDVLDISRISPQSGPQGGSTPVKIYGTGFTSAQDDVIIKLGTIATSIMTKSSVTTQTWSKASYLTELQISDKELHFYHIKQSSLTDGQSLKNYVSLSSTKLPNKGLTWGGPAFVNVGQKTSFSVSNTSYESGQPSSYVTYLDNKYDFSNSYVQFYYYTQPEVKKITPISGLNTGGTQITVYGAFFDYMPEYGVAPFCKIGDKVIRGTYLSTVRIICQAPPSTNLVDKQPFYVSLNGVDFVNTGLTFSYYEQPVLYDMTPRSGPSSGGTELYVTGSKFSNITDKNMVKCRFRSNNLTLKPEKSIPAYYKNSTTMMCVSPSGWKGGDSVIVDMTFNLVEYTPKNFTYKFFTIYDSFPKSGPTESMDQTIQVLGVGFNETSTGIQCILNNTYMNPVSVSENLIQCPMSTQEKVPIGEVPFQVSIDGTWKDFGMFYYYDQITLDTVSPKIGPSDGDGNIFFTGNNYRDNFDQANLTCKIGNTLSPAQIEDSNTIKCQPDQLELVDEGQSLIATLSLNGYSFVPSTFTYTPYGVTGVFPNSGPYDGFTDVTFQGKGFSDDIAELGQCRFGTEGNFVTVKANVLDYNNLVCRSPENFELPSGADGVYSVPVGVSFSDESYSPWTQNTQRFKMYNNPYVVEAVPDSVNVGKMAQVYVLADEDSTFFEPTPSPGQKSIGQYGIQCNFGRFGIGNGIYINQTTIMCITPSVPDDPESIYRETVTVTVAMNGQDFNEDYSSATFTFVGTGSNLAIWHFILGTLLIGLLVIACVVCMTSVQPIAAISNRPPPQGAFVHRDGYGNMVPRSTSRRDNGQPKSRQTFNNYRPNSRINNQNYSQI